MLGKQEEEEQQQQQQQQQQRYAQQDRWGQQEARKSGVFIPSMATLKKAPRSVDSSDQR